jgi:hypothetical protein
MADAAAAHERAARGNRGQRYDSLHAALAGRGFLLQAARARSRISLKPFLRSRGPTLCESPCPEACKAHMRVDVAAQARLLRWLTQGCSPRAQPIIEPVGAAGCARSWWTKRRRTRSSGGRMPSQRWVPPNTTHPPEGAVCLSRCSCTLRLLLASLHAGVNLSAARSNLQPPSFCTYLNPDPWRGTGGKR